MIIFWVAHAYPFGRYSSGHRAARRAVGLGSCTFDTIDANQFHYLSGKLADRQRHPQQLLADRNRSRSRPGRFGWFWYSSNLSAEARAIPYPILKADHYVHVSSIVVHASFVVTSELMPSRLLS